MADSDWEDIPKQDSEWEDIAPPSTLEATGRGIVQGASMGFSDEATGAGEAAWNKLTGDEQGFLDLYRKHRDESRTKNKAAQEAHPYAYGAGNVGGAIATALPAGAAAAGVKGAAVIGALSGLGGSEADLTKGDVVPAAVDTAAGAGVGAATAGLLNKVGGTTAAAGGVGPALKEEAGKFAEGATGATRNQLERFRPGAGKELLKRGIVKFFDSPGKIAQRAAEEMERSGAGIGEVLKNLDEQGVQVSRDELVKGVKQKIIELSKDESQSGVVRKLENILESIENSPKSRPISEVEGVKRGFQKQSNYAKPLSTQANKTAASVYGDTVEANALAHSPELAEKFVGDKQTYGLLAPVQEAAERRSLQLQQHPVGGFLDTVSTAGGYAMGGKPGALAAPVARRVLGPRVNSSLAVILDKSGNGINKVMETLNASPKGKSLVPIFQKALQRGRGNFAATYFLLNQTEPSFRQLMNEGEE